MSSLIQSSPKMIGMIVIIIIITVMTVLIRIIVLTKPESAKPPAEGSLAQVGQRARSGTCLRSSTRRVPKIRVCSLGSRVLGF